LSISKLAWKALEHLGVAGHYAANTIESYEKSYDQFRLWLHARGLSDDVREFTGDNVFKFAEWLTMTGHKASTVLVRLSALSTIAQTLMNLKDDRGRPYLENNPVRTFKWPTADDTQTKFLLPDELAAFLAVKRPLRESVARDILVDTAMRCSELCRAKVGDVTTIDGKTALTATDKSREREALRRQIALSTPVAMALYEYLLSRGIDSPQEPNSRDEPLLLNAEGRPWGRTGLSSLMARIGKEAGITRMRVSARKLHHTANVVSLLARRPSDSKLDRWTRSQLLG
jgi:site-specific recombinase XerD